MMRNRSKKNIILCLLFAALVCFSGCKKERKDPPAVESVPVSSQEEQTDAASGIESQGDASQGTEGSSSQSSTSSGNGQGGVSSVPVESRPESAASSGTESEVSSQSKPDPVIDGPRVVGTVEKEIARLLPDLKRDPGLSNATGIPLSVDASLSEEMVAATVHDHLLDIFNYDLYLEQENEAGQTQPIVMEYTYNIIYKGLSEDKKTHQFEVKYVVNRQEYKDESFDSNEILRQATAKVLESERIHVTAFEDDEYQKTVVIDNIPFFYTTEMCVERLSDAVEKKIYAENLGEMRFSQFRIVFHSKGETTYTFLLYLK